MQESCKKCMANAILFISKKAKEMICDWLIEQSNDGLIDLHNHEEFIERFNKRFKTKCKIG